MLAQNFMTAADLGLTEDEHWALVKVLGMLEREEISYSHRGESMDGLEGKPVAFNMWSFFGKTNCGTVCCICGWAEYVGNLEPFSLIAKSRKNKKLDALFDPPHRGELLPNIIETITPAQAAVALRNYMTTGQPRWRDALRDASAEGAAK